MENQITKQNSIKLFLGQLIRIYKGDIQKEDKKFLFLYISWFLFLLLLVSFALVGKSPLVLLTPFSFFDMPKLDQRTFIPIFLSDGGEQVYPSKRKVLWDKDTKKNIYSIIGEIGKSPFYESDSSNDVTQLNQNLKKLPNLQTAVISIWLIDKDSTLIIDMREKTILKEVESLKIRTASSYSYSTIYEEAKANIDKKKIENENKMARMKLLKSTFVVLEKTIFENLPNIKSILFRLDGTNKKIEDLEYDLSEAKARK